MTAYLHSYGWMTWDPARDLLGHAQARWLALEGEGSGALPERVPLAQRIHAWDSSRLWRLIPDHAKGLILVTALTSAPLEAESHSSRSTLRVEVDVARAGDGNQEWERRLVLGVSPLLFLRPTPAGP